MEENSEIQRKEFASRLQELLVKEAMTDTDSNSEIKVAVKNEGAGDGVGFFDEESGRLKKSKNVQQYRCCNGDQYPQTANLLPSLYRG